MTDAIANPTELEERLSRPSRALIDTLADLDGDVSVLGAGGKMGPSLARMARRALDECGASTRRVIAVSRFSDPAARAGLESAGVETIACDLLDPEAVATLPRTRNALFLAGTKFGTGAAPGTTWALNCYVPGNVARHFRGARTVAFSSGNVYPFVPVTSGGASEDTAPAPVGEYAQSVLGRERVYEHFARATDTPLLTYRLNYAVELRYGVLVDLGRAILEGRPIDLATGHVNLIWQGDANDIALRCLALAASPPRVLNVTGRETLSVRELATRLGERLGRPPELIGQESETALLADASRCHAELGKPTTPIDAVVGQVAEWLRTGQPLLGKPTKFEVRDGRF